MSDQHWFPLWCGDFLTDTAHLSDREVGQYILLLMCMWKNGGALPDDPVKLGRVAKCRRVSPDVMAFFKRENGTITQKRLTFELERARKVSERQRANANARWLKNNEVGDAAAMPLACPTPHHTTTVTESVPKETQKKRSQGSRIPPDWRPSAEDYEWATKQGYEHKWMQGQTEMMCNWAEANSHRQIGRKVSWSKTWRNWLMREWPRSGQAKTAKGPRQNGKGWYVPRDSAEAEAWKRYATRISDNSILSRIEYGNKDEDLFVKSRWPPR